MAVNFKHPNPEKTPFYPKNAVAKLLHIGLPVNYREAYGEIALYELINLILIHSRGIETFITRKVTRGICNISQGLEKCLYVGNLDALKRLGHAKDYVKMQWLMLQQDQPDDFVIATEAKFGERIYNMDWRRAWYRNKV